MTGRHLTGMGLTEKAEVKGSAVKVSWFLKWLWLLMGVAIKKNVASRECG